MAREESIIQELVSKYDFLEGKCSIKRQRRINADVPKDNLLDVIKYVSGELSFSMLCTITGLDVGDDIQLIYHLADDEGIILNLRINLPKSQPEISTVTEYYNGATLYEKELKDLLGVQVTGLPKGNRYPLPDGWPEDQHPLRKDWKKEMLDNACGSKQGGALNI